MSTGWIGVDFDGTLAHYERGDFGKGLGVPIASMVERVKEWRARGIEVRVLTARSGAFQRALVEQWCLDHVGEVLPVTNEKDFDMVELWDDRAVRVRQNEGEPCCDHHAFTR